MIAPRVPQIMLLILTNSFDATTDLLLPFIGGHEVFRFNTDLISDYVISWSADSWSLTNRVSHKSIDSSLISCAYWRKPLDMVRGELPGIHQPYYAAELRYVFREIVNFIKARGLFRLVEPYAETRMGKLQQLHIARQYFTVPLSEFCYGSPPRLGFSDYVIYKSLSGEEVDSSSVCYATRVPLKQLDYSKPWFLQTPIDAVRDVTCVYVSGWMLWSCRRRDPHESAVDVREVHEAVEWVPYMPRDTDEISVSEFMRQVGLTFGRLDFLEASNGTLTFLEVNPNGQYAWMDLDNTRGLLSRIATELN